MNFWISVLNPRFFLKKTTFGCACIVVGTLSSSLSLAASDTRPPYSFIEAPGLDQQGQLCSISAIQHSESFDPSRSHKLELRFELDSVVYKNILTGIDGQQINPIDEVLMKVDSRTYSRVIGAPITLGRLGLRFLSGKILLEGEHIVGAEIVVDRGYVLGKKRFVCRLD